MTDFIIDPDTDCWLWRKRITAAGYGRLASEDILAHRWMFEQHIGLIPAGMEIDHLCRFRNCVNPDHLEPVTHAENVRRGNSGEVNRARMLGRTHCARGHEWTAENTQQTPRQRKCRTCIREDSAKARQKRKAVA